MKNHSCDIHVCQFFDGLDLCKVRRMGAIDVWGQCCTFLTQATGYVSTVRTCSI